MLDGMRKAAQGPVGRFAMAAVMLLIIVGFVNWGVPGGGFFAGFTSDKVATVGDQTVTAKDFQNELQTLIYQYQRQSKVPLTTAQAHAAGLDVQLLRRMTGEAALNSRTKSMGLAISDETIAAAARNDPHLQDATGQFSKAMFDQALRDSGLSERGFFAKQRQIYLRQQLEYALVDGLETPKPVLEALAGAEAQTRSIDYFVLPPSAAGEIPAPAADALKSYFDERKGSYKAPEFRGIDILVVSPASLAKPADVSDEDAKAAYEKLKDKRFTIPEKRKLQQIVFANEAEANEAAAKIAAGATFDDIAKARNLTATDLDLGEVTKADIFDHAIGDAAFALPDGGVSGVVKGQFGYLLVRVLSVAPGSVQPFADVVATVKKDLATERASGDVLTIHDKIEDARVSGKSLVEAAKSFGLEAEAIPAVDAAGLDRDGKPVQLPETKSLLRAVFASDIGVDDAPLNTKDRGYVWFDVTKVDPAHDRPFDEVKDPVEKQWREEQVAKALSAKAADLVKQLDAGASLGSLAQAAGVEVKSASDIRRGGGAGLPESVVTAVFAVPADKGGSASTPDGRLVFKITGDSTPPFEASNADVKSANEKLQDGLRNSLLDQYISALQQQLGVNINERVLQAAEGG
jgi:peptidyl-prolyl cis-trans isomerase D